MESFLKLNQKVSFSTVKGQKEEGLISGLKLVDINRYQERTEVTIKVDRKTSTEIFIIQILEHPPSDTYFGFGWTSIKLA